MLNSLVKPQCHPDRKYYARGLCSVCYQTRWRAKPAKCHPDKPTQGRGLCYACYHAAREQEDPGYRVRLRSYKNIKERQRQKHSRGGNVAQIKGIPTHVARAFYETKLVEQQGVCAICGHDDLTRNLSLDHCHITNCLRGLLCGRCNSGIGLLNDDPQLLRAALQYLETATP